MRNLLLSRALLAAGMAATVLTGCSKFPTLVGDGGKPGGEDPKNPQSAFSYKLDVTPGYFTADGESSVPKGTITVSGTNADEVYTLEVSVTDPDGETLGPFSAFKSILDKMPRDISRVFRECAKRGRYAMSGTLSRDSDGESVQIDTAIWVKGPSLRSSSLEMWTPDGRYEGKDAWDVYQDTEDTLRIVWSPAKTICEITVSTDLKCVTLPTKSFEAGGGDYRIPFDVVGQGSGTVTVTLVNGDETTTLTAGMDCIYDEDRSMKTEVSVSGAAEVKRGDTLPVTVTLVKGKTDARYNVKLLIDGASVLEKTAVFLSSPAAYEVPVTVNPGNHTLKAEVSRSDGRGGTATASYQFYVREPVKVKSITVNSSMSLEAGTRSTVTYKVSPSDADDPSVDLTVPSGGSAVRATLGNGTVTVEGVAPGNAVIRLTARDGSGVYAETKVEVYRNIVLKVGFKDSPVAMNPSMRGKGILTVEYNPSYLSKDVTVPITVYCVFDNVSPSYTSRTYQVSLKKGMGTSATVEVSDVANDLIWPSIRDLSDIRRIGVQLGGDFSTGTQRFHLENAIKETSFFFPYTMVH